MSRTKEISSLPPITEREFQGMIIDYARLKGWRCAHFRPARLLDKDGKERWRTPVEADGAGWFDLVLVRPPFLYFVECKRDGESLSPKQQIWYDLLLACRSSAYIRVFVWHPSEWAEIEERLE